jgi:hypothetical protein
MAQGSKRDIQIAVRQACRAQARAGRADRNHFGVGGGIAVSFHPIAGPRQHLSGGGLDDHRADRHFPPFRGGGGLRERDFHGVGENGIVFGHGDGPSTVSGRRLAARPEGRYSLKDHTPSETPPP